MSKASLNLSIDPELVREAKAYVVKNPRAGRRNLSELTETLWINLLKRKGVKLPPRFHLKARLKPRVRRARAHQPEPAVAVANV
jgi:hypothetical protein